MRTLSDEQILQIAEEYAKGARVLELARQYQTGEWNILRALKSLDCPTRPRAFLSDEQVIEIVSAYNAGKSCRQIAPQYGVNEATIRRCLKRGGGAVRSITQAQIARRAQGGARYTHQGLIDRWDCPKLNALRARSPDDWSRLYHRPPYPSVNQLAAQFEVSPDFIQARLLDAGITLRTGPAQHRILYRYHGRTPPRPTAPYTEAHREAISRGKRGRRHSERSRANMRQGKGRRIEVPCVWCGATLSRTIYQKQKRGRCACNHRCSAAWAKHCFLRRAEPRPLIVKRLVETMNTDENASLLRTFDEVQYAARFFEPTEEEVVEALMRLRQ